MRRLSVIAARVAAVCLLTALVAACATQQEAKKIWLRSDGQRDAGNPALIEQFEVANSLCLNEREKISMLLPMIEQSGLPGLLANQEREADLSDIHARCMSKQGYLLVPENQAEAKRQELMAAEAARKSQQPPPAPARKPAPRTK